MAVPPTSEKSCLRNILKARVELLPDMTYRMYEKHFIPCFKWEWDQHPKPSVYQVHLIVKTAVDETPKPETMDNV
jgi:hypothetical protein